MKKSRVAPSVLFLAMVSLGLSSCSTSCGYPDVCAQPTPAYQQMSDEDVTQMTEKLDGLAGVSTQQ